MFLSISLIIVLVILLILYYLFPPIQVIGVSMFPTYDDLEIIFGSRIYRKSKLKEGEVIVYHSPTDGKIVIKRIDHISKEFGVYCLGDNSDYSYDSRHYGYVSYKNLICKVINQRRKM